MHINICSEVGVITAKNGFIVIIHEVLHGPFPYSMKYRIMSLFEPKEDKPHEETHTP